jgi:hypothetical protein
MEASIHFQSFQIPVSSNPIPSNGHIQKPLRLLKVHPRKNKVGIRWNLHLSSLPSKKPQTPAFYPKQNSNIYYNSEPLHQVHPNSPHPRPFPKYIHRNRGRHEDQLDDA